eukprot:m.340829 g.340829  ORF g.340829 m.340829 type:complete len:447 (+) comp19580_c0_seq1:199-1539(+)
MATDSGFNSLNTTATTAHDDDESASTPTNTRRFNFPAAQTKTTSEEGLEEPGAAVVERGNSAVESQQEPASTPVTDDVLVADVAVSETFAHAQSPPLRRRRESSSAGKQRVRSHSNDSARSANSECKDGRYTPDYDQTSSDDERKEYPTQRHSLPTTSYTRQNDTPSDDAVQQRYSTFDRTDGSVSLIVCGRRFIVNVKSLAKHPNTMLGRMFAGDYHGLNKPNSNGDYTIECDGSFSDQTFREILNYYEDGKIMCPSHISIGELQKACEFFLIPFTHETIQCASIAKFLHHLSNKGAESRFLQFLDELLTPAMARDANIGERQSHIVILDTGETVIWDTDMPPMLGEQYAQVVHSTLLLRFMRYHDNQMIAKRLLRSRGLKHVKIGVEGFPTFVEKIKRFENGEKAEVMYNYEQRPFIRLSWDEEVYKSRHVDFQTVRGRPVDQG